VVIGAPVAEIPHAITHRSIRVGIYHVEARGSFSRKSARWFSSWQLHRAAISQLARKISAQLGGKF